MLKLFAARMVPSAMNTIDRVGRIFFYAICVGLSMSVVRAQSKGVPIESDRPDSSHALIDQAEHLRAEGQAFRSDLVASQLSMPVPGLVQLANVLTKPMRPREVAARARAGGVHVGWYYLCPDCNRWHTKLLGGYAIARDAVATAYHCVDPDNASMREGYLIAVDSDGIVRPVTAVLAKNKGMDAVILRVGGGDLTPLALNDNVAPGDSAYCLSDPLGQTGYFSQGIVNRFFWLHTRSGASGSKEELTFLRMNVSTDWAPGSSGAAVLDDCGNVIGHVATISPMAEKAHAAPSKYPENKSLSESEKKESANLPLKPAPHDRFDGAILITLHAATPARAVLALVRSLNNPDPPAHR